MTNHLKAGELYAFATNDGFCIVGKVLESDRDRVNIYMYDRHFPPLTQKSDVLAALVENKNTTGYSTDIQRRDFALMYPLWLGQQETQESERNAKTRSHIVINGKIERFKRTRPYWEPLIILGFMWLLILVFALAVCIPNASLPGSLVAALLFSASLALPLGGTMAIMSVIFRFLEARRTQISIRTNPTLELRMPLAFEEAFTKCRDRLGAKTNREFDFVDRKSGYIQTRIQNHLLMRIMCYQIEENETGVIVSCFDLKGGAFGQDMWALKNVEALLNAQDGEVVLEQGPLVIGGILRKLFWFFMTATFACVSAMFLKAAIQGEHTCLPLLLVTAVLTGLAGFYLFKPAQEAVDPNS